MIAGSTQREAAPCQGWEVTICSSGGRYEQRRSLSLERMECTIKWQWLGVEERIISRLKYTENFLGRKIWGPSENQGQYYSVFYILEGAAPEFSVFPVTG